MGKTSAELVHATASRNRNWSRNHHSQTTAGQLVLHTIPRVEASCEGRGLSHQTESIDGTHFLATLDEKDEWKAKLQN